MDLSLDEIIEKEGKKKNRNKNKKGGIKPKGVGGQKPTGIDSHISSRSKSSRRVKGPGGLGIVKPTAAVPTFKLVNEKADARARTGPRSIVLPHTIPLKDRSRREAQQGLQRSVQKDGLVVTAVYGRTAPIAAATAAESKRERTMPEQRGLVEQLEIRIRNDRAITDKHVLSPNPHRAANAPPAGARHAAFPPAGLTSTSSSFRRPVAMMDMYSGRYARPSLEPYRPPPAVTQFYRALADTSHLQPIATFPSESQHQAPPRSSYRHPSRQHYLTQPYAPQSRGSPRTVSARFPGNPIRKPYE